MKKAACGLLLAAALAAGPVAAVAQGPGPGGDPVGKAMDRFTEVFSKLSFSAKAVMTGGGGRHKMPPFEFDMAVSEGNTRVEMDFAKMMAGAGMPEGMPNLGRMITITIQARKIVYQVMPDMNAYCEMPLPQAAAGAADASKIVRKVEGTETVEGYECEKVRNTITTSDGRPSDIMTWEAKKLSGFPIKCEVKLAEGVMTLVFKNINTAKPPASAFELPAGLTKYSSLQDMMMQGMMQLMKSAAPPQQQ